MRVFKVRLALPAMATAVLAVFSLFVASGVASAATAAPATVSTSGPWTSNLMPGQVLFQGQSLIDQNRNYYLAMQADGNLVLYAGSQALWHSHTYGHPGAWAYMQTDGNLVVYAPPLGNTPKPTVALWHTHTYGNPGAWLTVQTDGNVVVYNSTKTKALWNSGTYGQGTNTREKAAVSWELANAHQQNWDELCETAVEKAYGNTFWYSNARADYNAQFAAGRIHLDRYAPTGTLVFFVGKDPTTGHVGLSGGDGANYYTTDGGVIHPAPYSEGLGFLGWSYAPANR